MKYIKTWIITFAIFLACVFFQKQHVDNFNSKYSRVWYGEVIKSWESCGKYCRYGAMIKWDNGVVEEFPIPANVYHMNAEVITKTVEPVRFAVSGISYVPTYDESVGKIAMELLRLYYIIGYIMLVSFLTGYKFLKKKNKFN